MSQYATGRRKEWACVQALERRGWFATRSAGSHGLWDVSAARNGAVKFVQVKSGARPGLGRDGNLALFAALRLPPGVQKELWHYRRGATTPEVTVL